MHLNCVKMSALFIFYNAGYNIAYDNFPQTDQITGLQYKNNKLTI